MQEDDAYFWILPTKLWLVDCFCNRQSIVENNVRCVVEIQVAGSWKQVIVVQAAAWVNYGAWLVVRSKVGLCQVMCDERALTVRALGQRNLLDACPISTSKHLHLTLVLVELAVWPTDRLAVVTAVPVAGAPFKLLLLQTAEHIVALVCLHKTCKKKKMLLRDWW